MYINKVINIPSSLRVGSGSRSEVGFKIKTEKGSVIRIKNLFEIVT